MSGLIADSRTMVDKARVEAQVIAYQANSVQMHINTAKSKMFLEPNTIV